MDASTTHTPDPAEPVPAVPLPERLRSPKARVGGLVHFGRMLDKIRLHQAGQLPEDYHPNLGLPMGLDGMCCAFLGIDFQELYRQTSRERTDEELLEWCFSQSLRPSRLQAMIWNEFARKLGWQDYASRFLQRTKEAEGIGGRDDLRTSFETIIFMEGHTEPAEEAAT